MQTKDQPKTPSSLIRKQPPGIATRFSATYRPKGINLKKDAAEVEQLIMKRARNPKVETSDLASLVRAFVSLVQVIQELRGVPRPGQLRPDLDPVQMSRAIKRLRDRLPRDIAGTSSVISEPEEEETVTETVATVTEEKKESLLPEGTVTGGPGGGGTREG